LFGQGFVKKITPDWTYHPKTAYEMSDEVRNAPVPREYFDVPVPTSLFDAYGRAKQTHMAITTGTGRRINLPISAAFPGQVLKVQTKGPIIYGADNFTT
jgi:hypothetical protein